MKNLIALALFAVVYAAGEDEKKEEKKDDKKDAKKTKKDCTDDETACKAGAFDVKHAAVAKPDKALCTSFNDAALKEAAAWDCTAKCTTSGSPKTCATLGDTDESKKTCTTTVGVLNKDTCEAWVASAKGDEGKKNATGCTTAKTECDKTAGATTLAAGLLLATAAVLY
jgi:hypothetical protein